MFNTIIGILLIIMAVFLVIAVLMQSSKDHRHGGTIAGGAETFFGKNKGKSLDAMFNKLTTAVAVIFVLLVIILYVVQPVPTENVPVVPEQSTEQTEQEENGEEADVVEEENVAPAEGELADGTQETVEGEEVVADEVTEPAEAE